MTVVPFAASRNPEPSHSQSATDAIGECLLTPPPGLLREIAAFIYEAAPRPVYELAIAAAIGMTAGIVGRSHNVSGTGLNVYVLAVANTGVGKESINSGVSRLIAAVADQTPQTGLGDPSIRVFTGPADMASGQGLHRAIASRQPPSFVSIVGEFGLRLKQLADDRATSADTSLLRLLLDAYGKSGHGQLLGEAVYSDKTKDIKPVLAPAMSLLCETTPGTLFGHLTESMVANGLLPRFSIIEYTGPRPRRNRNAPFAQPKPELIDYLRRLATHSIEANRLNRVTNVGTDPDAEAFLDAFDEFADDQINATEHSVTRELWSRAYLKAAKLAALCAVGWDFTEPTITLEHATWARAQVERDIHRLIARFDNGDVGEAATNESKQQSEVCRVIREFIEAPFEKVAQYGATPEMHAAQLCPHQYISARTLKLQAFPKGKKGEATAALQRTLKSLIDNGEIEEIPRNSVWELYGVKPRTYRFAVRNPKSIFKPGGPQFFDGG